ncbi:MAG: hypothetical protein H3C42_15345 [Phycisphaerae bacterium]|jgi:hypothetical protein|nr:hypothetical protein [Phycisphaerae bacterium]
MRALLGMVLVSALPHVALAQLCGVVYNYFWCEWCPGVETCTCWHGITSNCPERLTLCVLVKQFWDDPNGVPYGYEWQYCDYQRPCRKQDAHLPCHPISNPCELFGKGYADPEHEQWNPVLLDGECEITRVDTSDEGWRPPEGRGMFSRRP